MAGYIGNKAVGINVTTGDILGDVGVGGDIDVDGTALVTGVLTTTASAVFNGGFTSNGDTVTFASANNADPLLILKNTANDINGSRIQFIKDKGAAGADGDDISNLEFIADNDAQELTTFAVITTEISDASNGAEGGKMSLRIATHDGELQPGLVLEDGNAEDEIDVTIAAGVNSNTVISGSASVGGQTSLLDISTEWSPITSTMFEVFDGTGGSDSSNLMLSIDTTTSTGVGTFGFANRNNSGASTATGKVVAAMAARSITSDNNAGDDSGGELKFYTKPEAGAIVERLHITSAGDVTVKTGNLVVGTDGKGIDFSAQTSANSVTGVTTGAELLDHYEEGTWTPVVAGAGGGTRTMGSSNKAYYTRVGRLVTITGTLHVTGSESLTGSVIITGIPFDADPTSNHRSAGSTGGNQLFDCGANARLSIVIDPNASFIFALLVNDDTPNFAHLVNAAVKANTFLYGLTITYMTDA